MSHVNFLQSCHHNALIGTGELIGEVEIDLVSDLALAKKRCRTRGFHSMAKQWLVLTNPLFPGKSKGELEVEGKIVTGKEGATNPVGLGSTLR